MPDIDAVSLLQCDCSFIRLFCFSVMLQDYECTAVCSVENDAMPVEVDEKQSHMKPVVALEKLDLDK